MQSAIERVLTLQLQYSSTNTEEMAERRVQIVDVLARSFEAAIESRHNRADLKVSGSNGAGNSAKVPWLRVFDPRQSSSPTKGWYVVLLFSADGSAVSLSLNQGVTQLSATEIAQNVSFAQRNLTAIPADTPPSSPLVGEIHLQDPGLGAKYEAGHVLGFEYQVTAVPGDEVIARDLNWLLGRLQVLPHEQPGPFSPEPQTRADDGDLVQLSKLIHWGTEEIQSVFEGLMDESPQIVLSGPPGTGKTFVAQHLAAYLLGMTGEVTNNPYIEVVQFHPSYGYEDFVEGLRPVPSEHGGLEFRAAPGVLLRLADDMAQDGLPRVLIIDEMNRANLPKVFGELMYLLEYRDQDIRLMHRARFSLPRNLYIIGTMNTADRSAKNLDLALRRRFDFFDAPAREDVLRSYFAMSEHDNALGEELFQGFAALNGLLETRIDKHHQVGHSYLMKPEMSADALRRIWLRQLLPLIEDYFFDRPQGAEEFAVETFWPSVHVA
jgi:hypothetical protein